MKHAQPIRSAVLVCLGLALATGAMAQQDKKDSRERQALRRAQQQLQQANQAVSSLQEKVTTIEQERGKLVSEVEATKARIGREAARASNEASRNRKLQQDLEALQAEREKLVQIRTEQEAQLKERAEKVAKLERDLAQAMERAKQLDAQGVSQRQQTAVCEERSARIYNAGRELLNECRVFSTEHLERLTGTSRVRVENRLEFHRDQLDLARSPTASAAAAR